MPKHRTLKLTEQQRQELTDQRDHAREPYLRERCAALLKVADGAKAVHVAQFLLLRPHKPDTIYDWLNRYQQQGIEGLKIREGRGRKPAFSPQHQQGDQAQEHLLHMIRRDPRQLGETKTRWTLSRLLHHCQPGGWKLSTMAGLCQILHRLRLHWKRGRDHVHSPDPDYQAKVNWITQLCSQVRQSAGKQVLLYLEEMTYFRQPSVGYHYELAGSDRPYAEQSYRSNTKTRLVGALDACSGRLLFRQASKIGINELVALYQQIACAYPQAERIWVLQDNWPVHFHPDVLAALEPQVSPFSFNPAPNWPVHPSPRAKKKWGDWHLPIQMVTLPSYASWLNPIEKLWRKLKQDVLHLHRWADDLATLRERVLDFLKQFACDSAELLQAVGLCIPS